MNRRRKNKLRKNIKKTMNRGKINYKNRKRQNKG